VRELIIDLDAIAKNLNTMRAKTARPQASGGATKTAMVMAVVKADAYGHGMIPVAKKLEAAGADYLGVADIPEALELRQAGIDLPILAWLHSPEENFLDAISNGIELGVANTEQLERIAKAASHTGRVARIHLNIDTGLGRNGSTAAEWPELLKTAHAMVAEGFIQVVAIFSHLSLTSEEEDLKQIENFEKACEEAKAAEITFELRHLAASDGMLRYPQAHYEMVRIGEAIYGLSPFVESKSADFGLIPAMTAVTKVTQTKRVPAGHGVGYGYLHRTAAESTLALIPVGYGDGLPRNATGRAVVSINGKNYPISSRVSMDQFVIDVGDDEVVGGSLVTIFGDPAAGVPSADDLAAACDTINYEIVTRMGGRFKRNYLWLEA
jgi:alanine racemase